MKVEPPGSLDSFLELASETTVELLKEDGPLIAALREFHTFFTTELWGVDRGLRPIPTLLGLNAHFYWLAAVRVALSGQITGVFPLLRTGLEAHCYAYLMMGDEALEKIWTNRDDGDDQRKACRRAFTAAVSEVADRFEAENEGSGNWILEHYDACIGWGGHPNPIGVFKHLRMEEREEGTLLSAIALHDAHSAATSTAMFACLDLGMAMGVVAAKAVHEDELLYERLDKLNRMKDALAAELFDV
jgi:hypothetical protein